MATLHDLADLIFKDVTLTIEDLEKKFPPRNLAKDAMVTRFAPSPTGFLHTGSLFTSLVSYTLAKQSNGVFYTRLEDTDTKREIAGSGANLIKQLEFFGINPDEGYLSDDKEVGNYGPYKQSLRADIYKVVIKHLLLIGRAYPCFCNQEELAELRAYQEAHKIIPGYYGQYAKCRNLTVDEQIALIKAGKPYIIRFKSLGDHNNKIKVHDEIRGDLELTENDQDIVILKSDGLPTYHFAHLVDDHFMHTTHITRGEEWLSSLPIHIDLFNACNFPLPKYAHLPVIMKEKNGNRRKLSKRKDKEAAVSFFIEEGYPKYAVIEYLLTLANSNYEMWREENLDKPYTDFILSFNKMSLDGALFDLEKIANIAKERLALKKAKEVEEELKAWAFNYDKQFYQKIVANEDFITAILNIDREKAKPRKDYAKYSDIYPLIKFFYNDEFAKLQELGYEWDETKDKKEIIDILTYYKDNYTLANDESCWFEDLKAICPKFNYAANTKDYKKNKEAYKGHVGDIASYLRIALTTHKNSPNLYSILAILGKDEVIRRLDLAIKDLNN